MTKELFLEKLKNDFKNIDIEYEDLIKKILFMINTFTNLFLFIKILILKMILRF